MSALFFCSYYSEVSKKRNKHNITVDNRYRLLYTVITKRKGEGNENYYKHLSDGSHL